MRNLISLLHENIARHLEEQRMSDLYRRGDYRAYAAAKAAYWQRWTRHSPPSISGRDYIGRMAL
jgi:hypothetical protein